MGASVLMIMPSILTLADDQAIDEEDDNGAYDGSDPAGAFSRLVQAYRAAEIARDDGADNTEDDGHDDAQLLIARHQGPCKQTDNKAHYDHADDTHGVLSFFGGCGKLSGTARTSGYHRDGASDRPAGASVFGIQTLKRRGWRNTGQVSRLLLRLPGLPETDSPG